MGISFGNKERESVGQSVQPHSLVYLTTDGQNIAEDHRGEDDFDVVVSTLNATPAKAMIIRDIASRSGISERKVIDLVKQNPAVIGVRRGNSGG